MEARFLGHKSLPDAFVALDFWRITDYDLGVEMTVQSQGFRGHYAEVSFFRPDVERFATSLRAALAGTSREDVILESMSPREAVLRIRSLMPDGDGTLEATLSRLNEVTSDDWFEDRIAVAFALSPSSWDAPLAALADVLAAPYTGE